VTRDSAPDRDEHPAFVLPGTGWPGDPADAGTPVASTTREVRELAAGAGSLPELIARQSVCRACPRLVEWREEVAITRRKSFLDEPYWGRPIPGWGDPEPSILIVGLAPAAHGGNRTGRVFTGDRSGDFLFASLYRCGLASQPTSVTAGDGLRLTGARMAAAVRCAPPQNKPTPGERDTCAPWLAAEIRLTAAALRVIVCLGGFAWQALWPVLAECGYQLPRRSATARRSAWAGRTANRCCCSGATTRASRTRSPAGSRRPWSMRSSAAPVRRPLDSRPMAKTAILSGVNPAPPEGTTPRTPRCRFATGKRQVAGLS